LNKRMAQQKDHVGQFKTLLQELNREDPMHYKNFLRVDADLFGELVRRVGPKISKRTSNWRLTILFFFSREKIAKYK
jgi:hypothetical protein